MQSRSEYPPAPAANSEKLVGSELLLEIAQRAQSFTEASGVAIALGQGGELVCCASCGTSAPEAGSKLRTEGTFTGMCVTSGETLRCQDARNDPRVNAEACQTLGIRAMVLVPLRGRHGVAGVLAVFAKSAHAFSNTHVAILETLAEVVEGLIRDEAPLGEAAAEFRAVMEKAEGSEPAFSQEETTAPVEPSAKAAPATTPASKADATPAAVPVAKPEAEAAPLLKPPVETAPAAASAQAEATASPAARAVTVARKEEVIRKWAPSKRPPHPPLSKTEAQPAASKAEAKTSKAATTPEVHIDATPTAELQVLAEAQSPATPPLPSPPAAVMVEPSVFSNPAASMASRGRNARLAGAAAAAVVAVAALAGWMMHSRTNSDAGPATAAAEMQQGLTPVNEPTSAPLVPPTTPRMEPASLSSVAATSGNKTPAPKASSPAGAAELVREPLKSAKEPVVESDVVLTTAPTRVRQQMEETAAPTLAMADTSLPNLSRPTAAPSATLTSSRIVPGGILRTVKPQYPEIAKRLRLEGTVVMRATVATDGSVRDVKVVSGNNLLHNAAVAAVRQWRYRPSLLNGQPVESSVEVRVKFDYPN